MEFQYSFFTYLRFLGNLKVQIVAQNGNMRSENVS